MFELDRQTAELYKHGKKLKLQGQSIAVLALLLERPGELITREELRKYLSPEDTCVDFGARPQHPHQKASPGAGR